MTGPAGVAVARADLALSTPRRSKAPRELTSDELATLRQIADVLVARSATHPAATDDPDLDQGLLRALDARADAYDVVIGALSRLAGLRSAEVELRLRDLSRDDPDAFYLLSTVVVGGWLLCPTTRERIGYQGQRAAPAPVDLGTVEVSDGILDPVLERGSVYRPTPS